MRHLIVMFLAVSSVPVPAESGNRLLQTLDAKSKKKAQFLSPAKGKTYQIGRSCLKFRTAAEWQKIIDGAVGEGALCMKQLGSRKTFDMAERMEKLLRVAGTAPLRFLCEEDGYSWSAGNPRELHLQADAMASAPGNPLYPAIHLNPRKLSSMPEDELRRVLFHESIHLLGYEHFTDIEYAYSCEHCCFNSPEDGVLAKRQGCHICKQNYAGLKDPKYIDDIMAFYKNVLPAHSDLRLNEAQGYIKEHRKERWAKFNVLVLSPLPFQSPFTLPYAKLLEQKYSPLTEAEARVVNNIRSSDNKLFAFLGGEGIVHLANAYFFYYEGDFKKAETELLKAEVSKSDHAPASIRDQYRENTIPFLEAIKSEVAGGLLTYYSDLELAALMDGNKTTQNEVYPARQRIIRLFFPDWNPEHFPPFRIDKDGSVIVMIDNGTPVRLPAGQ